MLLNSRCFSNFYDQSYLRLKKRIKRGILFLFHLKLNVIEDTKTITDTKYQRATCLEPN